MFKWCMTLIALVGLAAPIPILVQDWQVRFIWALLAALYVFGVITLARQSQ
jgi:hypothetical protein